MMLRADLFSLAQLYGPMHVYMSLISMAQLYGPTSLIIQIFLQFLCSLFVSIFFFFFLE
jgi:hypothetical protein